MQRPISLFHKSPRDKHAIYRRVLRDDDQTAEFGGVLIYPICPIVMKFFSPKASHVQIWVVLNVRQQGGELSER